MQQEIAQVIWGPPPPGLHLGVHASPWGLLAGGGVAVRWVYQWVTWITQRDKQYVWIGRLVVWRLSSNQEIVDSIPTWAHLHYFFTAAQTCTKHSVFIYDGIRAKLFNIICIVIKMKSFIAKQVISILVNLRYLRFKLLKYKENNKKICNTFDHNYNEKGINRKVLFCIIRWCHYFKNVKNSASPVLRQNSSDIYWGFNYMRVRFCGYTIHSFLRVMVALKRANSCSYSTITLSRNNTWCQDGVTANPQPQTYLHHGNLQRLHDTIIVVMHCLIGAN